MPTLTLPIQDGRYAEPEVACETAPMAAISVIAKGSPIYSPQFGDCKNSMVQKDPTTYVVTPACSKDSPPVTTYTIKSATQFSIQNNTDNVTCVFVPIL